MNCSNLSSVSTLKGQAKSFNGGIRKHLGTPVFGIFLSLLPIFASSSLLVALPSKADESINTIASWDGTSIIGGWGGRMTSTYGQTFTAPSNSSLKSFQLYTRSFSAGSQPYEAYLYEWNSGGSTVQGPAVWQKTGLVLNGDTNLNSTTFNINSAKLNAGTKYVFFMTTVGSSTSGNPGYVFGQVYSSPDNGFVYSNDTSSFTSIWDGASRYIGDLAFLAIFGSSGIGASSTLQPYADMQSIGLDALKNQRELVLNQAGDCDQKGWVVYDSNKTKTTSKTKKNQSLCVFAEGGYATGTINGTDVLAGYSTGNASSAYGVEWKPSKQWAVGASYGYGTTSLSNFNFQDTTSSISSNINSGNVYGVYRPDKHWKIAALFGYSDFSYSGSRTYLGDTANAKYSASGYTAALQASYDIPLSRDYNNKKNPLSPVRLKPSVGLAWGANQQGSFSESGSGTLVNVQGQTTNSLMGTVGVGLEAPILLNRKKSMVLTPRVGAAYQYDFLANQASNKSITANLQSDTTTSYTEAGQNRGANNAYLDLGADFQLNPQVALFASVNYQVFTNGDQFGYQGGVRVKF